jgi:hypothetical protein
MHGYEMHAHIRCTLMRLTSHAFHNLVHTHESALAKQLVEAFRCKDILGDSLLFASNDLSQIVELSVRIDVAAKLAAMMGERIANKVTFRHTPFSEDELVGLQTCNVCAFRILCPTS